MTPPSDIIGYVTSGNFSLARGTGHGIGSVSLAAYLELLKLGKE
jgi:ribonuclease P/MRP protein subunit POP1